MIRSLLVTIAAIGSLIVSNGVFAQAQDCTGVAGKYSGFFKGSTKVLLQVEPNCRLTASGGPVSAPGQGVMKSGFLIAKGEGYDLKVAMKDGRLVGEMSYGTTTDRNISFSKD